MKKSSETNLSLKFSHDHFLINQFKTKFNRFVFKFLSPLDIVRSIVRNYCLVSQRLSRRQQHKPVQSDVELHSRRNYATSECGDAKNGLSGRRNKNCLETRFRIARARATAAEKYFGHLSCFRACQLTGRFRKKKWCLVEKEKKLCRLSSFR